MTTSLLFVVVWRLRRWWWCDGGWLAELELELELTQTQIT
jgi:hypothetical protein